MKLTPLATAFPGPVGMGAGPMVMGAGAADASGIAALCQACGYNTVEDAVGVLRVAGREFADQFGIPFAAVKEFIEQATPIGTTLSAAAQAAVASQPFGLGYALDVAHRPATAVSPVVGLASVSPAAAGGPVGAGGGVDLRDQIPHPIQDQGARNTCVAFSVACVYEHLLALPTVNDAVFDLSEQFFFWACKRRDGIPTNPNGTTMAAAIRVIEGDGICQEDEWEYDPNPAQDHAGNPGHGPPPPGAIDAAQLLKGEPITFIGTSVQDYKNVLLSGRCAAFAVPVFGSLIANPQAKASGNIPMPVGGEQPVGGHAMCIVGFQDVPGDLGNGGGFFILRNSWGAVFGSQGQFGPGFGTIPYRYIALYGRELGISVM